MDITASILSAVQVQITDFQIREQGRFQLAFGTQQFPHAEARLAVKSPVPCHPVGYKVLIQQPPGDIAITRRLAKSLVQKVGEPTFTLCMRFNLGPPSPLELVDPLTLGARQE